MKKATIDQHGLPTGFYDSGIHGNAIPTDAVKIPDGDWQAHIDGDHRRYNGKAWVSHVAPSPFHIFDGAAWVFDSTQAAASQKALIGQAYSDAVQSIVGGYPQSEVDTWPKQEAEARAFVADNTVAVPFLSSLATTRGTTVDVVAAKVVANADAYITAIAALLGKRQKLDAQLDLLAVDPATTQVDIDLVVW